ncbi:MAG: 50S ribosomal protein L22 [Gammaproteobacteria bacterium]|nr:50S ribosomal protein L22 [Gammaproteobacteria bacterium]
MEVSARLRFARISTRKTRLAAGLIRGRSVESAANALAFTPRRAARVLGKVLNSAIANAQTNFGADIDELRVSEVLVDEAKPFRRYRARARGRGARIIKPQTHISVTVSDVAAAAWDGEENEG